MRLDFLTRPPIRFSAVLLFGTMLIAKLAAAEWTPNGLPYSSLQFQVYGLPVDDGHGGAYDFVLGLPRSLHAKRFTPSGATATGWPDIGIVMDIGSQIEPRPLSGCLNADGSATVAIADSVNWCARFRADGTIVPGWQARTIGGRQDLMRVLPADRLGNIVLAQSQHLDGEVRCWRLDSTAAFAPGYGDHGQVLYAPPANSDSGFAYSDLLPARCGGAWLAMSGGSGAYEDNILIYNWLVRLRDDGTVDSTIGNGRIDYLARPSNPRVPVLAPDGAGGVFVAWMDSRDGIGLGFPAFEFTYDIYITRVTADGRIAPDWPATGLPVCKSPSFQTYPKIVSDAQGGAFVLWGPSGGQGYGVHAQHILGNATIAPGWPANGKAVFANNGDFYYVLASDGIGGMFAAAQVYDAVGNRLIGAQHLNGHGDFDAPWSAAGYIVDTSPQGDMTNPQIVTSEPGSAILTWDRLDPTGIHSCIQKLVVGGVVATQLALSSSDAQPDHVSLTWTASGDRVGSATVQRRGANVAWETLASIAPDGQGQISYVDRSVVPGARYDYRIGYAEGTRQRYSAETNIQVPLPYRFALAGARPNPASRRDLNVAFSLAQPGAATLELYDVNGRRVAERSSSGLAAGEHTLRMGDSPGLAAGIYWLRLSQGTQRTTARVVIVE